MTDKQTTLDLLDAEYQNLRQAIDDLDDEQLTRVWFGHWSLKEIVSHLLGWEREMTSALQRLARGERPTPEGVDYSDGDKWNAGFALAMAPISAATVLATWRHVHMNYVNAAKAVPDERYGERDGKPQTVNRLLETSGTGHYKEHGDQIRAWRKSAGLE